VTHCAAVQAAHESSLQGWGRLETVRVRVARPESAVEAADMVRQSSGAVVTPRGLGRSYGDASYDDRGVVIDARGLDRYVAFDDDTGEYHRRQWFSISTLELLSGLPNHLTFFD
jgi:FAD/FMN-containing dehydrogenase